MARTRTLFQRQLPTILIPLVAGIVLTPKVANGQIVPDDTLGEESSTVRQDVVKDVDSDIIEGGATRGANLFHSFTDFNVETGRGAYFANPDTIDNILSRVTGSNSSQILGTLGVLGDANLFLINPNGIVFGKNARLDVGGSFFASTADSLLFDNGFEFSGSNPEAPPLLTVNIPVGLGFRDDPGSIENLSISENVGLQVPTAESFTLIGGDVSFDGGKIAAPGGRVELGGLAEAAIVGFDDDVSLSFPESVARADVSLTNGAFVDVSGEEGGDIAINVRNLELLGGSEIQSGTFFSTGLAGGQSGDITLNATDAIAIDSSTVDNAVGIGNAGDIEITTGSLQLTNGASISASTFGQGNAAQVIINASDTISINGEDPSDDESVGGIFSTVGNGATGNAGGIEITTGNLTLTNAGTINASTFGQGNAAQVTIKASDTISIDGDDLEDFNSGTYSEVNSEAEGDAGGVTIITDSLSLTNGGKVSASTFGRGNAGQVTINASDTISIDGEDLEGSNSGAFSQVNSEAEGDAGGVTIDTGSLSLTNGGEVNTSTFGQGNAGNITINSSDTVALDSGSNIDSSSSFGQSSSGNVNIITESLFLTNDAFIDSSTFGQGNAGDIDIETRSLSLKDGGLLLSSTFGEGNAGNVTIEAEDEAKLVSGNIFSAGNIFSTVGTNTEGNAGQIDISASSLYLTEDAEITTKAYADGNAGNITINATGTVSLDDDSEIDSRSGFGQSSSGDVNITTSSLFLTNDATLSNSTFGRGDAGDITIEAEGAVELVGGDIFSTVERGAVGEGGDIKINGQSLSLINGAQLQTIVREANETTPADRGNAGNINIQVDDAVVISGNDSNGNSSAIFSSLGKGAEGSAGNIEIKASSLTLRDGAFLENSTGGQGNAGNITIDVEDTVTLNNDADIFSNVESDAVATEGEVGTVTINAGSLLIADGDSSISTSTFGTGDAGNITLNIDGAVDLTDGDIFSNVGSKAIGGVGNIFIKAKSVSLTDGAQLQAGIFSGGQGEASGIISIKTEDSISFAGTNSEGNGSGIFSDVESEAVGDGNDIKLSARSISLSKDARLKASNAGQGDAGNITLNAIDTISITSNSQITSNVGSSEGVSAVGKIGNIFLEAREVALTDQANLQAGFFSNAQGEAGIISVQAEDSISFQNSKIFSNSETGAVGDGSDIELSAKSISLRDGAFFNANNSGQGNAGDIIIKTGSLSLTNGAQLRNSTFGEGNAGSVNIQANDTVQLSDPNSSIFSNVERGGQGNGGAINIQAKSLSLANGAQIQSGIRGSFEELPGGRGNGGKVNINVRDTVRLAGVNNVLSSAIFTDVESGAIGNGGDINIKARSLSLEDGGFLTSSSSGQGNAGNVLVKATDTISLTSNSQITSNIGNSEGVSAVGKVGNIFLEAREVALTDGANLQAGFFPNARGETGIISIKAKDSISFEGTNTAIFSNSEVGAVGDGSDIELSAKSISLSDGAFFNASNAGQGNGGSIKLSADNLTLNNNSQISAATESGTGGNIELDISKDIFFKNNSLISARAFKNANGGNVNINAENGSIVAFPNQNNDIIANAQRGNGGNINITAQGIFGLQERPENPFTNDIDASSEFGLQGTFSLNTPEIDPSQGVVELPVNVQDPNKLIAQDACKQGIGSSLVVTGRGGLPPSDNQSFNSNWVDVDLIQPLPPEDQSSLESNPEANPSPDAARQERLIPAEGWVRNEKGEIFLVAYKSGNGNSQGQHNIRRCQPK